MFRSVEGGKGGLVIWYTSFRACNLRPNVYTTKRRASESSQWWFLCWRALSEDRNLPSVVQEMRRQNVQFIDPRKKKKKTRKNKKKMEKHFSRTILGDGGKKRRKNKWDENHRKCDNKNEIYDFRLVIYLCMCKFIITKWRDGLEGASLLCHEKTEARMFSWQTIGWRTIGEKWKFGVGAWAGRHRKAIICS